MVREAVVKVKHGVRVDTTYVVIAMCIGQVGTLEVGANASQSFKGPFLLATLLLETESVYGGHKTP